METDAKRLLSVVAETLDIALSELDLDTDLHATGRMDSLAIVTLVAFVEDELGVKVSVEKIVPNNFSSVRQIAALIGHAQVPPLGRDIDS